jgi:type II secretory pathway component GspD/PulD (secretin)
VLLGLPDDARAREDKLSDLGRETRSTLPDDQLYRLVGDLHRHAEADDMEDKVLPVVRAAQGRPSGYDIDAARFKQLLEGPLAHVRRPVKVRVDAVGEAAAAEAVRSRLEAARLVYEEERATDAQAASAAAVAKTTITVGDSPSDLDRAQEVARVLGLPSSAIVVDKLRDVAYDVLVQVGADLEELLRLVGLTPTATPS